MGGEGLPVRRSVSRWSAVEIKFQYKSQSGIEKKYNGDGKNGREELGVSSFPPKEIRSVDRRGNRGTPS